MIVAGIRAYSSFIVSAYVGKRSAACRGVLGELVDCMIVGTSAGFPRSTIAGDQVLGEAGAVLDAVDAGL